MFGTRDDGLEAKDLQGRNSGLVGCEREETEEARLREALTIHNVGPISIYLVDPSDSRNCFSLLHFTLFSISSHLLIHGLHTKSDCRHCVEEEEESIKRFQ